MFRVFFSPFMTPIEPRQSHQIIQLNCLVLGESLFRIFQVKIAAMKTIGALRKAIEEEKRPSFDHLPPDILVIWKVSVPADERTSTSLTSLKESRYSLQRSCRKFSRSPLQRNTFMSSSSVCLPATLPSQPLDKTD